MKLEPQDHRTFNSFIILVLFLFVVVEFWLNQNTPPGLIKCHTNDRVIYINRDEILSFKAVGNKTSIELLSGRRILVNDQVFEIIKSFN